MPAPYVRAIKFTETGNTYTIRDGELNEKIDNLAAVATTGNYFDLENIPKIPTDLNNDVILVWNHLTQCLEWRTLSASDPEYDPSSQTLNVIDEIYDNNVLQSVSIEPEE